jgi:hypothetical protein
MVPASVRPATNNPAATTAKLIKFWVLIVVLLFEIHDPSAETIRRKKWNGKNGGKGKSLTVFANGCAAPQGTKEQKSEDGGPRKKKIIDFTAEIKPVGVKVKALIYRAYPGDQKWEPALVPTNLDYETTWVLAKDAKVLALGFDFIGRFFRRARCYCLFTDIKSGPSMAWNWGPATGKKINGVESLMSAFRKTGVLAR